MPHCPVREDWLALHHEPALEPELPIVDAHHHLWDRAGSRYLAQELLADIRAEGAGPAERHDIRATVFIQCRAMYRKDGPPDMAPLGEVDFANGVAAFGASGHYGDAKICAGIVAGADLLLGDRVGPVLDAMITRSPERMRGVRNATVWHADPAVRSSTQSPPPYLLLDARFQAGCAALAARNLVLDVWCNHTQLDEVYELARSLPALTVVIDHFGGPVGVGPYAFDGSGAGAGHDAMLADWRRSLARLAQLPNTYIKLGGGGMPVIGFGFDKHERPPASEQLARAWHPYFDTCVALFGPRRCMFESNFPVDKGMFSYNVMWNAFKRLASGCSTQDKHDLFHGTAARVYRLSF
jgi:predicted TIM-barrel fold metal-dependent hydrolase